MHDAEVKQLRDHAASVQRAADEAARRAAQELASVRADLEAVRASMQKERAAFAVAGAANNDAVWKARLVCELCTQARLSHVLSTKGPQVMPMVR